MTRRLAAVILAALLLSGCGQRDRIEEDEQGWDCHTMGNRQCGPTQTLEA